jgi:hypothetical protein
VTLRVTDEQVLAFRARASHLDARLHAGSYVEATHAGLQDSIPRAGLVGLHARVQDVESTDWDHPTLCQIWFRGGADYIIPRCDIAPFTRGTLPRDADRRAHIEATAQRVIDFLAGREIKTREVSSAVFGGDGHPIRQTSRSGRVLIRWNASTILAYECDRPDMDDEDARLELGRRFLRWFGPQTKERFRWWTGVEPTDATQTWKAMRKELVAVDLDDGDRMMLEADIDALETAEPIEGVRLIQNDDPWLRNDRTMLVADARLHDWVFPPVGTSPGYSPGAIVVDGRIVGVWQRQQRKFTFHPWHKLPTALRATVEDEALRFPIPVKYKASFKWDDG